MKCGKARLKESGKVGWINWSVPSANTSCKENLLVNGRYWDEIACLANTKEDKKNKNTRRNSGCRGDLKTKERLRSTGGITISKD